MESGASSETARQVLRIESGAIKRLIERLDHRFNDAVELLYQCDGRVVVMGMGKSGHIGRKIAATLASTGTPALFLHPGEALHGDLGMVMRNDVALAVSYSGQGEEMMRVVETLKRLGVKLVSLTGHSQSPLARASEVTLDVSVEEEACPMNLAPTASTTAALAMGDALAIALLERRGFSPDDFAALHPGGRLGRKLLRVQNVMHTGDSLPAVRKDSRMPDVIYEMSRKGLGMTTVLEANNRLAGIITDGDLRRWMEKRGEQALRTAASEVMTPHPFTLKAEELASAALRLMEAKKITSVVVVDEQTRVLGVVHLHDLWTLQLF